MLSLLSVYGFESFCLVQRSHGHNCLSLLGMQFDVKHTKFYNYNNN